MCVCVAWGCREFGADASRLGTSAIERVCALRHHGSWLSGFAKIAPSLGYFLLTGRRLALPPFPRFCFPVPASLDSPLVFLTPPVLPLSPLFCPCAFLRPAPNAFPTNRLCPSGTSSPFFTVRIAGFAVDDVLEDEDVLALGSHPELLKGNYPNRGRADRPHALWTRSPHRWRATPQPSVLPRTTVYSAPLPTFCPTRPAYTGCHAACGRQTGLLYVQWKLCC